MGLIIVAYALSGLLHSTNSMFQGFQQLQAQGSTDITNNNFQFEDFKALIEVEKYRELET